jgi:hypothetical protein
VRVCWQEDGPEALWDAYPAGRAGEMVPSRSDIRPKELEPSAVIRRFARKGRTSPPDQIR